MYCMAIQYIQTLFYLTCYITYSHNELHIIKKICILLFIINKYVCQYEIEYDIIQLQHQ